MNAHDVSKHIFPRCGVRSFNFDTGAQWTCLLDLDPCICIIGPEHFTLWIGKHNASPLSGGESFALREGTVAVEVEPNRIKQAKIRM